MLGLTRARFVQDGTGMAAVEQHTRYKRELYAGDAVTIRSALLEVKEKSIRMMHEMRDDASGEIAATSIIVGVHIDAVLRRSVRLPGDVRERALELGKEGFGALIQAVASQT